VDGEAELLVKDDEHRGIDDECRGIDDEGDIRGMKRARLLETILTTFFFFLVIKIVLDCLLELL
jgi:hypothetical protein